MEEQALSQIVSQAWTDYEKKKAVPKKKVNNFHNPPKPKGKAKLKSQNTIMEEAQLEQIVGQAWLNVEQ